LIYNKQDFEDILLFLQLGRKEIMKKKFNIWFKLGGYIG